MKTRVLADATDPTRNSFNLVRLTAAICVIISHSFLIPHGWGAFEPLRTLTSLTLGQHAVHVFFVISGLTLTRSVERNPNMAAYARARFLRIVPALVGFGLFFAFIMGPFVTSAPINEYFSDAHTWLYPLSVPISFQHAAPPPSVFATAPIPGAVNNPLWTIKYEVFAYLGLGIFASIGLLSKVRYCVVLLASSALLTVYLQTYEQAEPLGGLFQASKFSFCFLLGVLAYSLRKTVRTSALWLSCTMVLAVIFSRSPLALLFFLLLDAHIAIVLGAIHFGPLTEWTQQNDISYGTYIYGWPLQQFMIVTLPPIGTFSFGALSVMAALVLGYVSWKLIERPALRLKRAGSPSKSVLPGSNPEKFRFFRLPRRGG